MNNGLPTPTRDQVAEWVKLGLVPWSVNKTMALLGAGTRATPQAIAAVRAIKCAKQWGPLMTLKFLVKRGAVYHANIALKFEERRHARA